MNDADPRRSQSGFSGLKTQRKKIAKYAKPAEGNARAHHSKIIFITAFSRPFRVFRGEIFICRFPAAHFPELRQIEKNSLSLLRWRGLAPRVYDSAMQTQALPPEAEMRAAFLRCDAAYDGRFITAVKTTGIFCRPVCTARKPKPENVEFFPTPRAALGAGYRPCLRCKPSTAAGAQPGWVTTLLARLDTAPQQRIAAADLRAAGIEPARARRHFQRVYGMTFQAYARARRLGEAYRSLRGGATLDNAAADTGYESLSGFRDAFARLFALPPGQGRAAVCITIAWLDSPIGPLVAGATDDGICLLEFADRRMIETQCKLLRKRLGAAAVVPGENAHLKKLRGELAEYFAGERNRFTVKLIAPGTPFQERVWAALLKIPHGETRSYQDLATAIGEPTAVRAVAGANGMNRLAILIPCHRVINTGGGLGGYGGGLWRKQRLLALERGERLLEM